MPQSLREDGVDSDFGLKGGEYRGGTRGRVAKRPGTPRFVVVAERLLDGAGLPDEPLALGITVRGEAGRIFDLSFAGFYNGLLPCGVRCSFVSTSSCHSRRSLFWRRRAVSPTTVDENLR